MPKGNNLQRIGWSLGAQVVGGPSFAVSRTLEVDAYDVIRVNVPTGSQNIAIPGAGIRLLLITASHYQGEAISDTQSVELTYKAEGGATEFELDAPQMFLGKGGAKLLKPDGAPAKLVITNNSEVDIAVEILVGRVLPAGTP